MQAPLNIFGLPLEQCGCNPMTGFYRDGFCRTDAYDRGSHVVCAIMTDAFLQFSYAMGNDLITPKPQWQFPGLKANDKWCLCALRWKEAYEHGVAPPVVVEACAEDVLKFIPIEWLFEKAFKTQ
ncbi:MAG: DUF2237 family protein [Chitinophagaceae bacterium]